MARLFTRPTAPGSSGAIVTATTSARRRQAASSSGSGSRRCSGGWVPSRRGERYGPSRCTPSDRAAPADAPPEGLGEPVEGPVGVRRRRGDQGRQERGDAVRRQRRREREHLVDVGGHQVHAGEAVDLEVDEAGRGDAPAGRRRQPDGGDDVTVEADVTGYQVPVDERGGRRSLRVMALLPAPGRGGDLGCLW